MLDMYPVHVYVYVYAILQYSTLYADVAIKIKIRHGVILY